MTVSLKKKARGILSVQHDCNLNSKFFLCENFIPLSFNIISNFYTAEAAKFTVFIDIFNEKTNNYSSTKM